VLGNRWPADSEIRSQDVHGRIRAAQRSQDRAPRRIGERAKNVIKSAGLHDRHYR
jgi:hypothetical protein